MGHILIFRIYEFKKKKNDSEEKKKSLKEMHLFHQRKIVLTLHVNYPGIKSAESGFILFCNTA